MLFATLLKTQFVKTTDEMVKEIRSTYRKVNSLINVLARVHGMDSLVAKGFRKLREQMANTALRGQEWAC